MQSKKIEIHIKIENKIKNPKFRINRKKIS